MHYKIYCKHPSSNYIYVDLTINALNSKAVEFQLASWRPGRYELGNFAKNIKKIEAFDLSGNSLEILKKSKDLWAVETQHNEFIKITYAYHTSEINAGNCFVDDNQLYINPIHLCMYVPNRMHETHTVELLIPETYKIATSLKQNKNILTAQSFDELVDSPIIASQTLQSTFYEINNIKYHLHFNGECKPNFEKIKSDFIKFTNTQISFWGDVPFEEYHFIFLILNHHFYHGVEHLKSTVIALGPGYYLNENNLYNELLGVSSHELFHAWNIKSIRPHNMLPYNYTQENYSPLGYVYEGFTTYYGDLLLLTSKVFSIETYFKTLEERIIKHFHNYGRYNLSVADSSFDTWLDGYTPGAPYRKVSIYDEGNLIALMLDILILKHSNEKYGLKHLCQILYTKFAKKNLGYTQHDITENASRLANTDLNYFFTNYVYGLADYETLLNDCLNYIGIELISVPSNFVFEKKYGFKIIQSSTGTKVSMVAPYSPSWKSGLSIGDDIIAINNHVLNNDLNNWLLYYEVDKTLFLTVNSRGILKQIDLTKPKKEFNYFNQYKLKLVDAKSEKFKNWIQINS